ncbi:CotH kinase family protein [Endozoicomonas sp.]|uniref:CotH kinase family protein n=1 Tax=Endozoicomonas sp. TaxID=1892382 RepID=UPI00383A8A75
MKLRLDRQAHIVSIREKRFIWLGIFCLALVLIPSPETVKTLLIQGGYRSLHTNSAERVTQIISDMKDVPGKLLTAERTIPVLRLDIKYKEWQKLVKDRQKALAEGLIPEDRQYAKGSLHYQREKYEADIRLQGDLLDHVRGEERWSLRIELKKNKAILSTSRFALVSSNVRSHQGPELFRQTLKTAGFDIISPRHFPVSVVINGDDWGVMLLEQSFGQKLLAVNNRTEGLVIRLDLVDETKDADGQIHRAFKPRVIQKKKILQKAELSRQRQIALTLINDFLNGKRPASDVFDTEKLGQYLATADIWASWHTLTWNNWRWYYNPHTAKLEPIQSDVAVSPAKHFWLMKQPSHRSIISKRMLADAKVANSYKKALNHLTSLIDSGELFNTLEDVQEKFNRKLHASTPLLGKYDFGLMKQQAKCLGSDYQQPPCNNFRELDSQLHIPMQAMSSRLPWELMARLTSSASGQILSITNPEQQSLKLLEILSVDNNNNKTSVNLPEIELPIRIHPEEDRSLLLPGSADKIELVTSFKGSKKTKHTLLNNATPLSFIPRPATSDMVSKYPFITKGKGHWEIRSGNWKINDYLITPDNWQVIVQPGTTLTFASNAGLMVFGGLTVNGTKHQPVTLTRQSRSTSWSGLTVFGTESVKNSNINHLEVSYARSPKLAFWQPRGAAYFINSNLTANNMTVRDNLSEDALNVINSQITINQLTILNTLSDGFDCDFCRGDISNSQFTNIGSVSGGDGIDTSGSTIKVTGSRFDQVRDKAISAGENSQLTIDNSTVKNSNIAIVAKDRSEVTASNIRLENIKEYSLMSYTKKPIFGPATLYANDIVCVQLNCASKTLVEKGSTLLIDGKTVTGEQVNVKALYQGIMKSDKPK